MIRRSLLAATALVAALALSSCATFTDNANAARVGGVELPVSALAAMTEGADATATTDGAIAGDLARSTITKWIRVVVLETENGVPAEQAASTENLDSRLDAALDELAANNTDGAKDVYDAGPTTSGLVCLAVIPVASADDTAPVMDALAGGTSFADAAAQFSTDEGLAASGGVVTSDDGTECFPAGQLTPDFAGPATSNPVGEPFVVDTDQLHIVMVVRPFDDLSDKAKTDVARTVNNSTLLPTLVNGADVHVDSRYGYWDTTTAEVRPLGS